MKTTEPLATFRNEADGIESAVRTSADDCFAVTLRDTDADQVLPSIIICRDLAQAIDKAKEIVA